MRARRRVTCSVMVAPDLRRPGLGQTDPDSVTSTANQRSCQVSRRRSNASWSSPNVVTRALPGRSGSRSSATTNRPSPHSSTVRPSWCSVRNQTSPEISSASRPSGRRQPRQVPLADRGGARTDQVVEPQELPHAGPARAVVVDAQGAPVLAGVALEQEAQLVDERRPSPRRSRRTRRPSRSRTGPDPARCAAPCAARRRRRPVELEPAAPVGVEGQVLRVLRHVGEEVASISASSSS